MSDLNLYSRLCPENSNDSSWSLEIRFKIKNLYFAYKYKLKYWRTDTNGQSLYLLAQISFPCSVYSILVNKNIIILDFPLIFSKIVRIAFWNICYSGLLLIIIIIQINISEKNKTKCVYIMQSNLIQ